MPFLIWLFLWSLLQAPHVLVLNNGKKIMCERYEVADGRVTFYRNQQAFSIPETMVNWEQSAAETEKSRKPPQAKEPAPPGKQPDPIPRPRRSISLTNDDYREMKRGSQKGPFIADYRRYGNHIVVSANINGRQSFDFVLDTGAGATMISPRAASELGLSSDGESIQVVGVAGRAVNAGITTLDTISLGGASVRDLKVVIRAIPQLNQARIVGLLGQDFLDYFDVNIHTGNQTITLKPHGGSGVSPLADVAHLRVLENPGRVFQELEQLTDQLMNHYQNYLGMNAAAPDARQIQDLKRLTVELPAIQNQIDQIYTALKEINEDQVPEQDRADVKRFIRCYPKMGRYLREIQRFSRTLRTAYNNTADDTTHDRYKNSLGSGMEDIRSRFFELRDCP